MDKTFVGTSNMYFARKNSSVGRECECCAAWEVLAGFSVPAQCTCVVGCMCYSYTSSWPECSRCSGGEFQYECALLSVLQPGRRREGWGIAFAASLTDPAVCSRSTERVFALPQSHVGGELKPHTGVTNTGSWDAGKIPCKCVFCSFLYVYTGKIG